MTKFCLSLGPSVVSADDDKKSHVNLRPRICSKEPFFSKGTARRYEQEERLTYIFFQFPITFLVWYFFVLTEELCIHRVMLTIGCPMKFPNYPIDTQICRLKLQSFGYDTNHNTFSWARPPKLVSKHQDNHRVKMDQCNFTTTEDGKHRPLR